MADWKKVKKIDAHIHIIPDVVHKANQDSEDEWVYADQSKYLNLMKKYNIEQAIIMPLNDLYLMSMEFTVDAVDKNLKELVNKYPDKFYAMADIDISNNIENSKEYLIKAIEEYKLNGLKIHPMGTRKINIYPDNLNNITEIIKTTNMNIVKVIELENAHVIVCYK